MSRLRFHLDEDCQAGALASALREHGLDVVTTNELGLAGVDDETQLRNAAEQGRAIITNNIRDFGSILVGPQEAVDQQCVQVNGRSSNGRMGHF